MSLFSKILLWFWVSLLVIGAFLVVALSLQFRLPLVPEFALATSGKLQQIERQIAIELSDSPNYSWQTILRDYSSLHHVHFMLMSMEGQVLAGEVKSIPAKVSNKISDSFLHRAPQGGKTPKALPDNSEPGPFPAQPGPGGEGSMGSVKHAGGPALPPRPMETSGALFTHTEHPDLYWFGMRTLIWTGAGQPSHIVLLVASESMTGHGLFFDVWPWFVLFGLCMVLAGLLWLPFVRRLTRRVRTMMTAAESIGNGCFEVNLDEHGSDELARLGQAIKLMAEQLNGFVHGQKRFLGDIAHELGSPIARIQLGLGILEQRVGGENQERLQDVFDEIAELSALVNELLEFTRTDLKGKPPELVQAELAGVVERAVARESDGAVMIETDIPEGLSARCVPDLFVRALANLLRNAIRYAGQAGPVHVKAAHDARGVVISVRDHGPGVPEEELSRLFKPFYRVESSRSRDTGGTGLGLAIVATCVEACQGQVIATNADGGGLTVTITLKK